MIMTNEDVENFENAKVCHIRVTLLFTLTGVK
jgi:hypothetical protein